MMRRASCASCSRAARIRASHRDCPRVQDPYSLRCQPQVMGACLDQMRHAAEILCTEANAVSDNPLVFPDTGEVLSGGNFHAEPVAFAADGLALAIAEIGALSERRTALLMDANLSGLPPFLVREGRRQFRLHDRAGDRRRARLRKQVAGPSAQHRFAADVGQPGRSRQHGDLRRAAPRAHGRQCRGHRRRRVARGRAGRRAARAARDLAEPPAGAAQIRGQAAFWDRDRMFAPDLARLRALVEQGAFTPLVGTTLP